MSKGDWQRPSAVAVKEVEKNFDIALGTRKRVEGDGCQHQRRTIRENRFHCLDCSFVGEEEEFLVAKQETQVRICRKCGGERPEGMDVCAEPCAPVKLNRRLDDPRD